MPSSARIALATAGVLAASVARGAPAMPPYLFAACSPSARYCFRSEPDPPLTVVYAATNPGTVLWSMPHWVTQGSTSLSDNGHYLVETASVIGGVTVNGRAVELPDSVLDDPLLTFYRDGRLVKVVDFATLYGVWRPLWNLGWKPGLGPHANALPPVEWAHERGFVSDRVYAIKLDNGRRVTFDAETGKPR